MAQEYGKTWKLMRSMVHDHLNVRASVSYVPYQDLENRQMLLGLLEQPDKWRGHLKRYINSLTTQIVFGFRSASIDDKNMNTLYQCVEDWGTTLMSFQAQLLDISPVLQRLPNFLVPVKRKAAALHKRELDLYLYQWNNAKDAVEDGTANPCFASDLVIAQKKDKVLSDNEASYLLGSIHEAGSDSTLGTLMFFMQAMVLYPAVARTAHEHLDRVCGDRLPRMEDEKNLQYIRAVVKEILRWLPAPIMGMVRSPMRDDDYEGYRIPKGATVVMNVWTLHNNEEHYPNPRVFDPSRYENDYQSAAEAAHNADYPKRDHYGFGAGRRLCQGMHIAERSLFLAISRFLWAFDFKMQKDELGNDIVPDPTAMREGVLVQPEDFPMVITPRSEKRAEAVREEWRKVEGKLNEDGQWRKVPAGMFSNNFVPLT